MSSVACWMREFIEMASARRIFDFPSLFLPTNTVDCPIGILCALVMLLKFVTEKDINFILITMPEADSASQQFLHHALSELVGFIAAGFEGCEFAVHISKDRGDSCLLIATAGQCNFE